MAVSPPFTWTGNAPSFGTDTLWSAPGNWNTNSIPPADADVLFGSGFSSSLDINVFGGNPVNTFIIDTNQPFNLLSTDPSMYKLAVDSTGESIQRTVASSGVQTISAPVVLNPNGQIDNKGSGTLVVSGPITFNALDIKGGGTVELDSSSNSGTSLNVISSTLIIPADAALGNSGSLSQLTMDGGTLITTANVSFGRTIALDQSNVTFAPAAGTTATQSLLISSGPGAGMIVAGAGTFVDTGENAARSLTLQSGTFVIGGDGNLGINGGTVTFNGGALSVLNQVTLSHPIQLLGAATIDTHGFAVTENGPIGGSGSLVKVGDGTLAIGTFNTYAGNTTISSGVLSISDDADLGSGTNSTIGISQGATLLVSGTLTSQRSIVFDGQSSLINVPSAISGTFGAVSSNIGGAGLLKVGQGTLSIASFRTTTNVELVVEQGTLRLIPNSGNTRLRFLEIDQDVPSTARLDLTNDALICDYTSGSPLGSFQQWIKTGYAGGAWTGLGITSSTAADDAGNNAKKNKTGIGYADASELHASSFAGESVDNTTVLLRYTYYGDSNLDGKVDVTDLGNFATHWQQTGDWFAGDFNYDGSVNVTDLGILATNWQAGVGNPLARESLQQALAELGLPSLPEPAVLVIFLPCTILNRPRQRRRVKMASC